MHKQIALTAYVQGKFAKETREVGMMALYREALFPTTAQAHLCSLLVAQETQRCSGALDLSRLNLQSVVLYAT